MAKLLEHRPITDVVAVATFPKGQRRVIRIILVVCSLMTAWHVFATFLWVAPVTAIRQVVPGNLLTDYMIPMYGQSWSVFAPVPINGNYNFNVRASWSRADGKIVTTSWINAAKVELSMSRNNLFPPRAASAAIQEATAYKDAYDALGADAKTAVASPYVDGTDWRQRLQTKLTSLGDVLPITVYMNAEYFSTAYATQVAKAVWGTQPTSVQFRVDRTNIQDFVNRHNAAAPPMAVQIADTGWRPLVSLPGQSDANFAAVFNEARLEMQNAK